jgi:hypothetical protein
VGDWRTLHNEEIHNLYASPSVTGGDQVKESVMGRACSTDGSNEKFKQKLGQKT